MKTLLDWNNQGWDIYYILNEVKPEFVGIKPSDRDMVSHQRFIIDYDKIGDIEGAFIPFFPCQTMSVFTGRGVHCYVDLIGNIKEDIKTRARRIGEFLRIHPKEFSGFRVDTCTSDASRMVRLPCTINWKSEVRGFILQGPIIAGYFAEDLPQPREVEKPPKFNGDLTNLSQVMPRLNRSASRFLLEGVSWERHKSAYGAARNLRECGVEEEQAQEWVGYGASLCEPPLGEKEARYCVWSAYKA